MSAIFKIHKTITGNCILALFLIIHSNACGQTNKVSQFWNKLTFTKPLAKGWSTEFYVKQIWSSDNNSKSLFADHNQWQLGEWIHFYPGARWKTSFGIGYLDYQEVAHEQSHIGEWRWSIQAAYYLKKIGYRLTIRSRIENRGRKDSTDIRTTAFRFREELKFVYPLGSKIIRGKIWYLIASDEVMFQSTLQPYFDRNRLTAGVGYALTDDVQIETTYVNQYIQRQEQNELDQVLQVNFVFNNLLSNLKNRWKKKPEIPVASKIHEDE